MFNLKKSLHYLILMEKMDEHDDYDIQNYSIEDMKTLLGLQDIMDIDKIYEITNAYITLSETKNKQKIN